MVATQLRATRMRHRLCASLFERNVIEAAKFRFRKKQVRGWRIMSLLVVFATCLNCFAQSEPSSDFRTPEPLPQPHLNGPTIYGARPGHAVLYRIPCTGTRPIRFAASPLPHSLHLDRKAGILYGDTPVAHRDYAMVLSASNAFGSDRRKMKIVVGDQVGLTPQMGWNDWYTFYGHVSEADVRAAAAAMIGSGMADFGYQYVDIDDAWAGKPDPVTESSAPVRDPQGDLMPNSRFPDMQGLTRYIHGLGLKAGIYSSPGPLTCARYEGSWRHEDRDARQFASWGFDLLKYDWCSYRKIATDMSLEELQKPYRKMAESLARVDRDIVLNICQYGMGDVWKWGREVGGNSWRTTGDLGMERNSALPAFYRVGLANAALSRYASSGGWNDPDYILIGTVGDPMSPDVAPHPTAMTHDEQYSYMSMWALMAAPLFFAGDMARLDRFTLNVLCNSEIVDIDQDSLGVQASIVRKNDAELILEKPLNDGSRALGLFNLTAKPRSITVPWAELDIQGAQSLHDVWRQRNLGESDKSLSMVIAGHSVEVIKLTPHLRRRRNSGTSERRDPGKQQ